MFNVKFGTDDTLEPIKKYFRRCDDVLFVALMDKAQDYKWCTPHLMSSPPFETPCIPATIPAPLVSFHWIFSRTRHNTNLADSHENILNHK